MFFSFFLVILMSHKGKGVAEVLVFVEKKYLYLAANFNRSGMDGGGARR
jgi:hypothetical protein